MTEEFEEYDCAEGEGFEGEQRHRGAYVRYQIDRHLAPWLWSSKNFWTKVDKRTATECWNWTGSNSSTGGLYGIRRMMPDGTIKPQMTQARRVMFAEVKGYWPTRTEAIYHICANRLCVNPAHFTLERQADPNSIYRNYREPIISTGLEVKELKPLPKQMASYTDEVN